MKKFTGIMFSAVVCSTLLAGCSGAGNDNASVSSSGEANTKEKVKIEFFNQKSEVKQIMDEIIADFEVANPDIDVEQVQIPDARNVLYARMASDDMPDIVSIFPNETDFKNQADEGYFLELTGETMLQNVETSFLEDVKHNDKDYSMPLTLNTYGIFYNVAKFDELGIKVPETWAELEEATAKIKEAGYVPFATSFKEAWTTGHLSEALIGNSMGLPAANEFFSAKGTKSAEDAGFKTFADRMAFIADNTQPDSAGTDYATAVGLFATEQALMLPQGIWAVPVIEQAGAEFEYKSFAVPGDEAGNSKAVYGVDYAVAIAADTEYPEQAKKFVEYLSTTEVAQKLHDTEKSPSVIKGVEPKNDATVDITSLLGQENRAYQWIHFDWAPGLDPEWQNMTAAFFITKDFDTLANTVDTKFEK